MTHCNAIYSNRFQDLVTQTKMSDGSFDLKVAKWAKCVDQYPQKEKLYARIQQLLPELRRRQKKARFLQRRGCYDLQRNMASFFRCLGIPYSGFHVVPLDSPGMRGDITLVDSCVLRNCPLSAEDIGRVFIGPLQEAVSIVMLRSTYL